MAELETWEYNTTFVEANIKNEGVREFMNKRWPEWKEIPKYAPQTMMPVLNDLGSVGWELVHMEPVCLGDNNDVLFPGNMNQLTIYYFCVFKRRTKS